MEIITKFKGPIVLIVVVALMVMLYYTIWPTFHDSLVGSTVSEDLVEINERKDIVEGLQISVDDTGLFDQVSQFTDYMPELRDIDHGDRENPFAVGRGN